MKKNLTPFCILILLSYCSKNSSQPTPPTTQFFTPVSFPIEVGTINNGNPLFFSKSTDIFIAFENGDIFHFNVTGYIRKYKENFSGKLVGIIESNLIIEDDQKIIIQSPIGKREEVISMISKNTLFHFISASKLAYYTDKKIMLKYKVAGTWTEELLTELNTESEPTKIFAIEDDKGDLILFWNVNGENYWWRSGQQGILGRHIEKERLSFYYSPSAGGYVAIVTKETFGSKKDIKVISDKGELKDYLIEIAGNTAIIIIPEEKFPTNLTIYAEYEVVPERQDDFIIFKTSKDIYFIDIHKADLGLCKTYLGKYHQYYFKREMEIPYALCDISATSNSVFYAISLKTFTDLELLLFWDSYFLGSKILPPSTIFLTMLEGTPYIYLVRNSNHKIYLDVYKW